ncbi:MAG: alpha/beta hydrolase family protein [Nannocystaceae bacterium]|nr:alpha/beta hydrolase family protein [Nannocystaceae bacterium]
MAVLSVIAHRHTCHALYVGRAGLHVARALDETDAQLYDDLVSHDLEAAARKALEHAWSRQHIGLTAFTAISVLHDIPPPKVAK